ncbi:hypothetical protein CQW23_13489 [Capsicum baccatum]|uniref:Tyrosine-protein phosphatase domain-containing protein n=1 Tax=Capsicum baccatum TaxID=33114 RepID=A0A2G2WVS5_CAPBA|nr:hypothetical protein CQW23_13489 [Capsicum baccatum]
MSGKEDASAGGADGCQEPCQLANSGRRYWRSASWLSSRTSLTPLNPDIEKDGLDPNGGFDDIGEWPLPSTPSGRDTNSNSERHKLDLSNIHKNPEINGGLVRREKISFFDKECSKVAEHVFLGGDAVAKDKDILKKNGITHVLNCVGCQGATWKGFCSLLPRGLSVNLVVIAYLMWREGQSFDDAFEYVKAARSIADPNIGFACQLLQCQKSVHALPLSPGSSLRMYRVAPHSPYDPLHLTLKMLNDPSPSALDSRGEFIIHIPSSLYIWIGKKSDAIMERDARGAVCQIVRYEKVQGPIITVMEGEEPFYFWDAFSNFLPLMDKLKNGGDAVESSSKVCPGERKVDMYNIDFEIFQKATLGDFVPAFASCETEHETHLPVRESSWRMLRRKFVSGNMKDFVFSTRSGISGVYPDSIFLTIDSFASKPLPSSCMLSSSSLCSSLSSTSSASSPPYLSRDSILSDLSIVSKCLLYSPVVLPSLISFAELISSTPSKTSKYIDVNFASQTYSQSTAGLSKKCPLSIAERRGSLSKFLKLPLLTDDFERKPGHLKSDANEQGDIGISEVTNESFNEAAAAGDILQSPQEIIESKVDELHMSRDILGVANLSGKKATVFDGFHESWEDKPWNERSPTVLNGVVDTGGASCLGKDASRSVYVWVGWSFSRDFSKVRQVDCNGLGDPGQIDWKQVALDALHQMVLSIDTNIKVVHPCKSKTPRAIWSPPLTQRGNTP